MILAITQWNILSRRGSHRCNGLLASAYGSVGVICVGVMGYRGSGLDPFSDLFACLMSLALGEEYQERVSCVNYVS